MNLSRFILCLFAIFCGTALAQTARQLFNPAAKEYIYSNTAVASNLVEQALVKFPKDKSLLELKKLIEQQKQDQQKQQDQDQREQQKQQEQNEDNSADQPDQSDPADQKEQKNPERQEQKAQPSHPQQAGKMSEEEAQQLLDAMKQNEKDQRSDLRPYLGQPVRVQKNW